MKGKKMNRFMQYVIFVLVASGFLYIHEILKFPGNSFIEKYNNMSAYYQKLYEKELKKQQNKG